MRPAAVNADDLQQEKADERAERNAPGEARESVVPADETARDDGKVVDDARERRNEELLARLLHGDEEAPREDEELPRKDDAPEVSGAVEDRRVERRDGSEERDELAHPDERRDDEREEQKSERIHHVTEKFPGVVFLFFDDVAREDRNEDDGEKPCAHEVIQDVRDEEGEAEAVLFGGDAGGAGEKPFGQDTEHATDEDACGDDKCCFIHLCAQI